MSLIMDGHVWQLALTGFPYALRGKTARRTLDFAKITAKKDLYKNVQFSKRFDEDLRDQDIFPMFL